MAGSADTRVYLRQTDENGAVRETFSPPGALLTVAPILVGGVAATVGSHLTQRALIGHTAVSDQDYTVQTSDVNVGFTTLTASRIVTLCDVDTYPFGQDLVIGDETGACSETVAITVRVGSGTNDSIPQTSDNTLVISSPRGFVRLRRGAANIWLIR